MAVDIDKAKAHLGIDWEQTADQEALVTGILASAIRAVENRSHLILVEREVTQRLDHFWGRAGSSTITLNYAPVVSVEGIDYLDDEGTNIELLPDDDFRVVIGSPGMIFPPIDGSWPTPLGDPGSIIVRYTAGYGGTAGDAPEDLDAAVLFMVGHLWHNREAVVTGTIATELPMAVETMCDFYRPIL